MEKKRKKLIFFFVLFQGGQNTKDEVLATIEPEIITLKNTKRTTAEEKRGKEIIALGISV